MPSPPSRYALVAATGVVQIRRLIAVEQRRGAESVALGVARASELALAVRDARELTRLANSFLRDDNVLFIAIYADGTEPLATAVRDAAPWDAYRRGNVDRERCVIGEGHIDRSSPSDEFSGDPDTIGGRPDAAPAPGATGDARKAAPLGRVVVGISTAQAIAAQRSQTRLTIMVTIIAAFAGSVLIYLSLGAWLRRLQALADASQAISRGDFGEPVQDTSDDEIGMLGRSFEGMRVALGERDQQLRTFNQTLQSQVKERTHDLEVALAAAEEASRAKSLFLANMSHELRTPLNGVIGMVDLLLGTSPTPQQRRYCDVARSSAGSLLELINDILDFSKIEAGKLELEARDFDLHGVVESVAQMLGERADKKSIDLGCGVGRAVPRFVRGDETRLRQVILNLASNALKFTEKGSVMIGLVLEADEGLGLVIKISVRDTGIGIPRDRVDRLFKSFSQIDASTTRRFGGTGLGLAISQRIVEMMGGQIGVESVEGQGSTFWFTARFGRTAAPHAPREAFANPRGLRVLVVDDNRQNLETLGAQLASWSLRADLADNGRQAMELLRAAQREGEPFRFAIIDTHMPNEDGVALARRIKEQQETRDVLLIGLGSISDPSARVEPGRQTFVASLSKPALPSQLYDAIVDSLAADSAPVAPSPAATPTDGALPNIGGVQILLAEDNEINRFVASELLQQAGCHCTMAVNGREALDAALAKEFDVILMDCQMPEMDGFEATRRIRAAEAAAPGGRRRPIIALTANAIKGDRELCLAAGMDDYVTKPIDPETLFRAISSAAGVKARPKTSTKRTPAAGADRADLPQGAGPAATASALTDSALTGSALTDSALTAPALNAQAEAPPVNVESLQKRCLGNGRIAANALGRFDVIITKDIELLTAGLQRRDATAVATSAHKIKGAAANVSADQLSRVAAELEKLARNDGLGQSQDCLDRLLLEMNRFRTYVSTALARLNRSGTDEPGAQTKPPARVGEA